MRHLSEAPSFSPVPVHFSLLIFCTLQQVHHLGALDGLVTACHLADQELISLWLREYTLIFWLFLVGVAVNILPVLFKKIRPSASQVRCFDC